MLDPRASRAQEGDRGAGHQLGQQVPLRARLPRHRGVLQEQAAVGLLRRDPGQVADVLPMCPVASGARTPLRVGPLVGQCRLPASILSLSLALRSRGSSADSSRWLGTVLRTKVHELS